MWRLILQCDRPEWRLEKSRLHVGDQADVQLLNRIVNQIQQQGKGLDVVVDDGKQLLSAHIHIAAMLR